MTMTTEIRELTDTDLEAVSGGWGISLFVPSTPTVSVQHQVDASKERWERQQIMSS
jgi:hypothetical protein